MWGKGIAYPLFGDKVFVDAPYVSPDAIWEVEKFDSNQWGMRYTLVPWPHGTIRSKAPDQRRDFPLSRLKPLDVLTQIYVEVTEASGLLS
jgi:hypothetical protein